MADNQVNSRRRWRTGRIVLIALAVVVLIVVVLVALAPTIASGYVPAMAQRGINDEINGRATVGRASLSWGGPQRIGPIEIVDPDGRPVANIEIETERGLIAILRIVTGLAPMDLGTTTVRGTASVIRRADGTIHLQDVFQPGPPDEPPGEIYLPETLSGSFVLDALDVTYIDERQIAAGSEAAVVRIPALAGSASIRNATRLEAQLAGYLFYGPTVELATWQGGSIEISAVADDLTEPDGRLAPELARYSASIDATDVSVAIADLLADMDGVLVQAIGDRLQAQVRLDGQAADGRFTLNAAAPGLEADLRFVSQDAVLQMPEPGVIRLRDGAFLPLIPGFAEAMAAQDDVTLDELPGATITIDEVRIPLPLNGRPLDFRGGSFAVAMETGETVGRVRVPQPDGTPGEPREYRLAPIRARIASADLADRITVEASTQAMLGGESAGQLEVDLAAIDPLDQAGWPRSTLARDLDGIASLTGFATIIFQPFVEGMGINMAQDVGPELDFVLRASATAPEAPDPAALPPTELLLDVRSANITAAAGFLFDQNVLVSNERGVEVQLRTLAPMFTRLFAEQGLRVDAGAGASLTASDVRIDLARLFAEEPDPRVVVPVGPDLRAISGMVQFESTATHGQLALADQPVRRWQMAPLEASIDAADLQRGIRIQAQTSARLEGAPAGTLDADVRITELLDAEGRATPGLPAVDGRASISQIATAILQPMVQEMGLDLQNGIGPHLDLVLTASSEAAAPAETGGPALLRSILDVTIRSEGVNGVIPLALEGRMLRTRDDGGRIDVRSPGVLLGPAARDAGVELAEGGFLRIIARDIAVAIDQAEDPLLDRMAGEVEVAFGGFAVRPLPGPAAAPGTAPATPLALNEMVMNTRFAPERTPVLTLRGSGTHEDAAFYTEGSLQLVGLAMPLDMAALRPIGQIEVRNLPTSLVHLALPPDPVAMDAVGPARLIEDLVGPAVNINIESAMPPEGGVMDRRLTMAARSRGFSATVAAELDREALQLRQFDIAATVAPALAASLVQMIMGEQLAAPPRVVQPARFTLSVAPLAVPLVEGLPDFAAAGDLAIRAGLEGRLLVDNLVLAETELRPQRPLGVLGLQDFSLQAEMPLRALAVEAPPAQVGFELAGTVLGSMDGRLLNISSRGQATVTAARPVGTMTADMRINITDGARLDQLLAQDGMLVQGIGQTASLSASARVQFPSDPGVPLAAQNLENPYVFERATVEATLTAPRLRTPEPLRLAILPDRFTLEQPASLQWQMHQNWANRYLLGIMPGAQQPQQARFTQPTPLRLDMPRLTLSRGENVGPLLHGIFETQLDITSPGTQMNIGGVASQLSNVAMQMIAGHEENTIGFSLRIEDAGGGQGPDGQPAVRFAGGIYNIADSLGQPTPDAAMISTDGTARNIPTAMLDGFAEQDGFLIDGLGPLVNMDLEARGVSPTGGQIVSTAWSDRARAELSGTIHEMNFVADQPVSITVTTITPEMGRRITRGLPLVDYLEKTPEEEAATITATNLHLPLDGDLSRLSGQLSFDPGEARYGASRPFARVLRLIDEPREAVIGRRLDAVNLTVTNGILSYDRFNIPIGEFTMAMQGNVDLVNRRIDVTTFVPFGALAEEVSGDLRGRLGRLLGVAAPTVEELTMVPFRARGDFERFSLEPDMDMFARGLQRELLRPERILEGPARDLLDRLRPRRDGNQQEEPEPQPP